MRETPYTVLSQRLERQILETYTPDATNAKI